MSLFSTFNGFASEGYIANAVNFDGTNDGLKLASDLTGAADSKLGAVSFWFKTTSIDTNRRIIRGNTNPFTVTISNGKLSITGYNSAGTLILSMVTVSTYNDGVWHHFSASWDMSDTGKRHMYVDDSSDLSVGTYTNDTIDYTCGLWGVGSNEAANGDYYTGDLADLYFQDGEYIDLSVATNRRKFINASNKPVYLGSDGSIPTGTSSIMFFSGDTATWHTNKGTGGGFTEVGALTTASTSPSD